LFVVCDLEANGLKPDKLWVVVCREVDNPENVHIFERPDLDPEPLVRFAQTVTCWIGHNFISYDYRVLTRLVSGLVIDHDRVIDTLVVSRLLNFGIEGGHSLEAWGEKLGQPKIGLDISDWSCYNTLMKDRGIQDTYINYKLYEYFKKYLYNQSFSSSLKLEHKIQFLCNQLEDNGFSFDIDKAKELYKGLTERLQEIDNSLVSSFPSSVRVVKEFTPQLTKQGTIALKDFRWIPGDNKDLSWVKPGEEYSLVSIEPYDPNSIQQTIDRLWEAGWKPTEPTKGHSDYRKIQNGRHRRLDRDGQDDKALRFERYGWKLSEENLRTLPESAPEGARRLAERLIIASRCRRLEEWFKAFQPTSRAIHGNFNGIGSWTHRMSHSNPNMANVSVAKRTKADTAFQSQMHDLSDELRSCWRARPGKRLIGVDADGIQMRIFAHYVNDQRLIKALVEGRKEDGTDIHSLHWSALGDACAGRDPAKTFIYAWLLGAGTAKVAEIFQCSRIEARRSVEKFIGFYPGLRELKQGRIPRDFDRGYFVGLDGRLVATPKDSDHFVLAGYLQNGEAIVMKHAAVNIWIPQLIKEKLPFTMVNFVHDEYQTEVDDNDDIARHVAQIQMDAIVQSGLDLGLNCPLAGSWKQGYNWKETH